MILSCFNYFNYSSVPELAVSTALHKFAALTYEPLPRLANIASYPSQSCVWACIRASSVQVRGPQLEKFGLTNRLDLVLRCYDIFSPVTAGNS